MAYLVQGRGGCSGQHRRDNRAWSRGLRRGDPGPIRWARAHNVGGINLNPSNSSNWSGLRASNITGDLSGTTFMQVKPPSVPPGQEAERGDIADLTVDGSVTGNVTVEGQITTMIIENDLSGTIDTAFIYINLEVQGDLSGELIVDLISDDYELEIFGDVSGDLTIDRFGYGAVVDIDGTVSGDIHILQDIEADGPTVAILEIGELTGTLGINGDLDGTVDINGRMMGPLTVGGDMNGTIDVQSHVEDILDMNGDVNGDILVGGNLEAKVDIEGDLDGDIAVDGDANFGVEIAESIKGNGRILIDGILSGDITIERETVGGSLIRATEGVDAGATVTINNSRGNYNANGSMYFGDAAPLDPVNTTFDGNIVIKDNAFGGLGKLEGPLTVRGCHATTDDLDICICGSGSSYSPVILQNGCSNQVDDDCVTGCP